MKRRGVGMQSSESDRQILIINAEVDPCVSGCKNLSIRKI